MDWGIEIEAELMIGMSEMEPKRRRRRSRS
jgi:hypothetical protein